MPFGDVSAQRTIVSGEGHSLLGHLLGHLTSRQPPPVRDVYFGEEAPEWATAAGRPSHRISIQARLEQSRVVPLDLYRVYSTRSHVLVIADLPGVKASEVFFAVDPGILTICSEARPGHDDRGGGSLWQLCREMRRGRYSQTLALPDGLLIDRWTASFEDGVLRLWIPRSA